MPTVLRIVNRFNLGGPSYNAAYLTRYLAPEFTTVLVGGSPQGDEAHSGFILDQLGVPYRELPFMGRSIHPLSDMKAYRELSAIIRQHRPTIVHTHAAKSGALGRMAAWSNKVPVIVHTFHGHVFSSYFGATKTALLKKIERFLASKSDAIIAISKSQKYDLVNKYRICAEEKAHVIPLGLDLRKFSENQTGKRKVFREQHHIAPEEFCLAIIGRFAPVKNHALFFEALHLLKTVHQKKFRALVIGDGDAMADYKNKVLDLGIRNEVVFTSWLEEVDSALAASDLVVLTSKNEGTPVSLIEAQAAMRPVISTDVGGVRDCMINGTTGALLSSFDPSELAQAMNDLMDNSGARMEMGHAGHAFVHQSFSYTRLVDDMRSLYHELMQRKNLRD